MAVRKVGLQRDRLSPRFDAVVERGAALGLGRVFAQPVVGARQFSRGVKRASTARDKFGPPDLGGSPRAGEIRSIGVELTCLVGARDARRRVGGLGRQSRDIE